MPEPRGQDGAVGILGGTFDPAHNAHLALARAARDRLGLAEVVWIPAGQPPHRTAPLAAPADRLAMVRAAIAGERGFSLDASEVNSIAPSYTVHTLLRLRETFGPDRPLVLLMGADAFLGLPGWHRWREILDLAHVAVATRPGFPLDAVDPPLGDLLAARRATGTDFSARPAGAIVLFELVAGTVSATEARALIAAGASRARLLELLPAPVLDYIHQHSLYSS
ncbi:MAG: nicotinate-nucleotide adenylyltransferase [Pseudomonadota bacterium]